MPKIIVCLRCGKEKLARAGRKFCSRLCASTKPKVKWACKKCGVVRLVRPWIAAKKKFCSSKCYQKGCLEYLFKSIQEHGTSNECLIWPFAQVPGGYGVIKVKGKRVLICRLVYETFVEPLADDLFALHKCDNPRCYNPLHLFSGTHQGNMDDMIAKGRHARKERHGNAKLTNEQVALIRELRKSGLTGKQIVKSLDLPCSPTNVLKITGHGSRAWT